MINFLKQLLDCIYKKRCYICRKSLENIKVCSSCYKELKNSEFNHSYDIDIRDGVQYYTAALYAKNIQKLIRGIKYHEQRELAQYLAQITFDYWVRFKAGEQKFSVVPVPLFYKREKQRKYNHMALIADEFCKLTGYTLNTALIKRIKNTKPQYGLSKNERVKNMKDAFNVDINAYQGENVLLFDDILTTGATMQEMIAALKSAGVENITVLTISATRL